MRPRGTIQAALAAVAAALAVLLVCAPGALARKPGPPPPNFWGVDSVNEPNGSEFGLMANSGVEVYRMMMSWRGIEKDPPVEVLGHTFRSYDWREPDRYVRRAAQTGVRLQVSLNETPSWIEKDKRTSPMRSSEGRAGWKDFVAAVVARYGRGGEFWRENTDLPVSPPLGYQIWNEQNTTGRYLPAANPAEYGHLMRIAGREIRAAEPGAQILPGGMFGTPQTPRSMKAWVFMRKLLAEPGVRRYIDAVAIHPYSPNVRGIRYQFHKMRKVLRKSGLPQMPLQVTELGWSSGRSKAFFFFKGRRGQARLLRRSFKLMLRKRRRWKLERLIWFSWRDVDRSELDGTCGFCPKFGLLETDLTPKPSYRQFTRFTLGR